MKDSTQNGNSTTSVDMLGGPASVAKTQTEDERSSLENTSLHHEKLEHASPTERTDESGADTDSLPDTEDARSRTSQSLSRVVSEVRDGIENRRDLELGSTEEFEKQIDQGDAGENDPNLVSWAEPYDLENPKQWAFNKKWALTFCGMFGKYLHLPSLYPPRTYLAASHAS
jgi:hypothetical protein